MTWKLSDEDDDDGPIVDTSDESGVCGENDEDELAFDVTDGDDDDEEEEEE